MITLANISVSRSAVLTDQPLRCQVICHQHIHPPPANGAENSAIFTLTACHTDRPVDSTQLIQAHGNYALIQRRVDWRTLSVEEAQ